MRIAFAFLAAPLLAQGLSVSGGFDLRGAADREGERLRLEGVFLNLRQVFSSGGADRYAFVLQGDSGEQAKAPHLYQAYGELKGDLGRWKLQAGRFIVPFGLLATYDSERYVLKTLEPLSLGLKLDEGLAVLGYTQHFDYAMSLTEGVRGSGPVFTGRVGHEGEGLSYGFSLLAGRLPETTSKERVEVPGTVLVGVPMVRKTRAGLDLTWMNGPLLWRGELVGGRDGDRGATGAYLEGEQALDATWAVNWNTGIWNGTERRWRWGAGLTRTLGTRGRLRAAWVKEVQKEGRDGSFVVQLYWDFAKQL